MYSTGVHSSIEVRLNNPNDFNAIRKWIVKHKPAEAA